MNQRNNFLKHLESNGFQVLQQILLLHFFFFWICFLTSLIQIIATMIWLSNIKLWCKKKYIATGLEMSSKFPSFLLWYIKIIIKKNRTNNPDIWHRFHGLIKKWPAFPILGSSHICLFMSPIKVEVVLCSTWSCPNCTSPNITALTNKLLIIYSKKK